MKRGRGGGVSEVGSARHQETVSRGGERRGGRGLIATVSAPKKHLEAHGAEEERRHVLMFQPSRITASPSL